LRALRGIPKFATEAGGELDFSKNYLALPRLALLYPSKESSAAELEYSWPINTTLSCKTSSLIHQLPGMRLIYIGFLQN
jgi:hypothetical protein